MASEPTDRTSTRPSATKNRTERPAPPPTASRITGIPARRSTARAAAMLRSPICTEPGVMSWANMLAPPASLATRWRGSAPSAVSRSTRSGTAVSGNLARLVTSRARLFDGRRIWAMAPAPTFGSCSMIATHDPRPSVTMTASPRSAAQSATLTIRSFGAGGSCCRGFTRRPCDRSARVAPPARGAHAPGRPASRPCRGAASPPARAPGRPDTHVAPARLPEPVEPRLERVPRLEVAEELGDVDGERIEEQVVLVGVLIEEAGVVVEGVDAARAHPHGNAAAQAAVLVGVAGEAARPRDLPRERPERPLVLLRRHDSALNVSRLALTSSCFGLISSALRHNWAASSRLFRLYAMFPSLK